MKATQFKEDQVSNEAAITAPYVVEVKLSGVCALLFHRWSCEGVEAKSKATKNSAAKKRDDLESYLYRDDKGYICIPGEYLRQAVIEAAKYRQDPRSPRKCAKDLFKAGVVSLVELASTGVKEYSYVDRRRVCIQRAGITRERPALSAGWTATFQFMIQVPEYINKALFHEVLTDAGRLVGLGDFRPTYGRFQVDSIKVLQR